MPMPKMFGREVPPVPIESVPDRERPGARQERRKEIVHEKIVRYADAVVSCMRWIDTVTVDMPREEVFERLDETVESILEGISEDDRRIMREYHDAQRVMMMFVRRNEDHESDPRFISLFEDANNKEEKMERVVPDWKMVEHIQSWADGRRAAWEKAHAYQGNPKNVIRYFNQMCHKIPIAPLRRKDVASVRFEPFCTKIILTRVAFIEYFGGDQGDFVPLGISSGELGVTLVMEHKERIEEENTSAHEIGHQLLRNAPIHRSMNPGVKLAEEINPILAWRRGREGMPLEAEEKAALRACMRHALERLHEEFLAEFYVILQSAESLHIRPRHWSTAEMQADYFEKTTMQGLVALSSIDKDYADRIFRAGKRVQRQFQRAKVSMIEAFMAAQNMPDQDARRFVVATAVVMPIRSYHHIWDILTAKYGADVVESAKAQLLTDGLPEFSHQH